MSFLKKKTPQTALEKVDPEKKKVEVDKRRLSKRMLTNPVSEIAKMVIETTGGGRPLIEFLWDVHQGKIPGTTVKDRMEAGKQLLARGFGEAPKIIKHEGNIGHTHTTGPDFSKMTDEELAQFRALAKKANAGEAVEVGPLAAKAGLDPETLAATEETIEDAVLEEEEEDDDGE